MGPTVDFGKAWTKAWVRTLARLTAVLVLAACGGDGSPTQPDGGEGSGGGGGGRPRSIKAEPSFSADIQEAVFDGGSCTAQGCHGDRRSGGLDLRAGAAYGNLVNKAAQAESGFIRVVPNNAQDSYLVIALEDRRRVGGLMPQGNVPLDSIDLANIRNWIEQGALNN